VGGNELATGVLGDLGMLVGFGVCGFGSAGLVVPFGTECLRGFGEKGVPLEELGATGLDGVPSSKLGAVVPLGPTLIGVLGWGT